MSGAAPLTSALRRYPAARTIVHLMLVAVYLGLSSCPLGTTVSSALVA